VIRPYDEHIAGAWPLHSSELDAELDTEPGIELDAEPGTGGWRR